MCTVHMVISIKEADNTIEVKIKNDPKGSFLLSGNQKNCRSFPRIVISLFPVVNGIRTDFAIRHGKVARNAQKRMLHAIAGYGFNNLAIPVGCLDKNMRLSGSVRIPF